MHDTAVYGFETGDEREEGLSGWLLCRLRCEKRCGKVVRYECERSRMMGIWMR